MASICSTACMEEPTFLQANEADELYSQLNQEASFIAKETFRKICEFDLSREKAILTSPIRGYGFTQDQVDEMESEYKKYLFIRVMHPQKLLPMSKEVDDFWHAHVLNTRNYLRFMQEVAGGSFIHHGPTVSEDENIKLMPNYLNGTIALLTRYFGEPNERYWKKRYSNTAFACCSCG